MNFGINPSGESQFLPLLKMAELSVLLLRSEFRSEEFRLFRLKCKDRLIMSFHSSKAIGSLRKYLSSRTELTYLGLG